MELSFSRGWLPTDLRGTSASPPLNITTTMPDISLYFPIFSGTRSYRTFHALQVLRIGVSQPTPGKNGQQIKSSAHPPPHVEPLLLFLDVFVFFFVPGRRASSPKAKKKAFSRNHHHRYFRTRIQTKILYTNQLSASASR